MDPMSMALVGVQLGLKAWEARIQLAQAEAAAGMHRAAAMDQQVAIMRAMRHEEAQADVAAAGTGFMFGGLRGVARQVSEARLDQDLALLELQGKAAAAATLAQGAGAAQATLLQGIGSAISNVASSQGGDGSSDVRARAGPGHDKPSNYASLSRTARRYNPGFRSGTSTGGWRRANN